MSGKSRLTSGTHSLLGSPHSRAVLPHPSTTARRLDSVALELKLLTDVVG